MSKSILPAKEALTVFLYHDVNDVPSQFGLDFNLTVSNELFRKQVAWITANYSVVSPVDLVDGKQLPDHAALITFDDGFDGAFKNGISYLVSLKIPSIVFLNMSSIEKGAPLISSTATFLQKMARDQESIYSSLGLKTPFHLHINPVIYSQIQSEKADLDLNEIIKYQGKLAGLDMLKEWENSDYVFYGNHLYEHWNSSALSSDEFKYQFIENRNRLSQFKNSVNLFSFPNGQPGICFSNDHIRALGDFGCKKIFFSSGGVNSDNSDFLLNRMDLTTYEHNRWKMFYRVAMTRIKQKFLKRAAIVIRRFL